MTDTAPGASVWEGNLLQMVQGHVAAEEHIEDEYRELASAPTCPMSAFSSTSSSATRSATTSGWASSPEP